MQKVDGVKSVQVSLKEGMTTLELRADNRVTLARLRTVIKNNGFVSKVAQITAKGTPRNGGFEISGTSERLKIAGSPKEVGDGEWQVTAVP